MLLQVSVVADTVNITGQSSLTPFRVPDCRLADDMSLSVFGIRLPVYGWDGLRDFLPCLLVLGPGFEK